MRFYSFDADYLRRLASGDSVVESHFTAYFGELLNLKLRVRLRSLQLIEDVRQETLLRVLQIVRKKGGVEFPERFGAFVNAVCNNVLMEMLRADSRHDSMDPDVDPRDHRIDLDADIVTEQSRRQVREVLEELPEKDRNLLRMVFLEEEAKADISQRLQVSDEYLRVLLHRAKSKFRSVYSKRYSAIQ